MIVDYSDAYIHNNMFVARVLHFSAFINKVPICNLD